MHINPIAPQPFDESRIPNASRIRTQVEKILHDEGMEAEKKLHSFAHNALSYKQDHQQMKAAADSTQEQIGALFDEKKEKIMTVLHLSLSRPEAEKFYNELKSEWHDKYNVEKKAEEILAAPKHRQSPEDLFRSKSSKAPAEDTAPPGALPGASPQGVPDFADIWKKIMEKFQEEMLVDKIAGEFTKGGMPSSPELQLLLSKWNTEKNPLKKDQLFEEIKGLISGNPPKGEKSQDKGDKKPPLPF